MSVLCNWLFGQPADDSADAAEIRAAQMASIARQTPINSLATLATSGLTAGVLWAEVAGTWVALWAGAHILIAAMLLCRWWSRRGLPTRPRVSERGPRKAKIFAWAAGAAWGAGVAFMPFVPPEQQLALIIVTVAMAGSASTTLAAIPGAAGGYIMLSILPYAGYFVSQGDPVYFGLAVMALVMALAMLGTTRVAYGALLDEIRTKQANAALLTQFQSERRQWLDISNTAEAFALFDEHDRLLLWNENYCRILSLPESLLKRGTERRDLLLQSARPVGVDTDKAFQAWIAEQLARPDRDGAPDIRKYSNGRWIRSRAERKDDGHTVAIHTDVTAIMQAEERATQLAAIVESTADAVISLDLNGIVTSWNDAATRIFGYSGENLIGKSIAVLPPPDRLEEVTAILGRVKQGERISNLETVRRTKNGSLVDVSLTSSPVHDDSL